MASPLLMHSLATPDASRKRTAMTNSKMFKVLCPMESKSGHKWWMRMGSGFRNKDESINVYLDAIPTHAPFTLQLREFTDEDMKQSAERRAARTNAPGSARVDASFDPTVHGVEAFNSNSNSNSNQSVPF
jgi:hypothetical protein